MATKKMQEIKLLKLNKLLESIYPELQAISIKSGEFVGVQTNLGNCVIINGMACQRLLDNGFNAKLVGGKAAFSVNKSKFGVLDFGYSQRGKALTASGETNIGFLGHCWIEIKKLGVIVDLTLPHLEQVFINNNRQLGIAENEYKLTKKMVIPIFEVKSWNALMQGELGYHYLRNSQDTDFVISRYEKAEPILIMSNGHKPSGVN